MSGQASHIFWVTCPGPLMDVGNTKNQWLTKWVNKNVCVFFNEGNPKPSQTPLFTVFRQDPTIDIYGEVVE